MKRTPIITIGQVYLHMELNEYAVVTKSTKGDIEFKGNGFGGLNEVEIFLERFGPVDPEDLTDKEQEQLCILSGQSRLLTGWVEQEEEEEI